MMSDYIQDCAVSLVSGDNSVDLNGAPAAETSLYTVPTGFIFIPVMIILDEFSAAVTAAVITAGIGGGDCDEFLGNITLTNIDGTSSYVILQPVPSSTPVELIHLTAGQSFSIEITTAEGSALTCKAEVLGLRKTA
jgi:hypothetical protein